MRDIQTPRSDAAAMTAFDDGRLRSASVVPIEFARQLEREIERLRFLLNEAKTELESLYDERFRGNGALDRLANLDEECGL